MDTGQNTKLITDLPIKQAAIMYLSEQGYKNNEIAKALSLHCTYPSTVKTKLKKWDITDTKTVSLAYKANKMILQAVVEPAKLDQPLPFTVKGADVNACIDRVVDRAQPIKRDTDQLQAAPIAPVSINILFQQAPVSFEQKEQKTQFNVLNSFPHSAITP
jgi:hypothetical protein